MDLDSVDQVLLFTIAATAVLVLLAIVEYVIEVRRAGNAPWSEFYNDRFVPMFRGWHKHA